jgi:hypothetical protein
MVRGTILERTAEGDVTISLPSGETRRFAKKDIAYAGPIGGGAPQVSGPASAPGGGVVGGVVGVVPLPVPSPATAPTNADTSVTFSTDAPDVQVHLREASATMKVGVVGYGTRPLELESMIYKPLCVAPCTAIVPGGMQRFGLSHGDDGVADVSTAVDAKPGSKISFHFESNESVRTTGKAMFWTGLVGGSAALIAGVAYAMSGSENTAPVGSAQWKQNFDDSSSRTTTGVAIGLIGGLIGAGISVAGGFIARTRDDASLATSAPASSPSPTTAQASAPAAAPKASSEEGFPGVAN